MKVLLHVLLLLLLCSIQVLTLRCYTCNDHNDNCKTKTDCEASAQYCKTVVRAGDIVSRTCEETCEMNFFTKCCQEDFCYN